MNHYDRLSDGEKVLALHKTFNHLRKVTEVNLLFQLLCVYTVSEYLESDVCTNTTGYSMCVYYVGRQSPFLDSQYSIYMSYLMIASAGRVSLKAS